MDSQEPSIFTRIMQGEIPSYRVYEDDVVYSMLDINPLSDGHVLVIPRQQVASLWDLDVETYSHLWATAHMLARHMQKVLQPQRVGVVVEGFEVPLRSYSPGSAISITTVFATAPRLPCTQRSQTSLQILRSELAQGLQ